MPGLFGRKQVAQKTCTQMQKSYKIQYTRQKRPKP